jgi:putative transposase
LDGSTGAGVGDVFPGAGQPELPTMVFRDRDVRFTKQFDAILKAAGVPTQKLTPGSPNLNAYIERWIQSIKHECLDHFTVFGERHLRYLINEYVGYYHEQKPHQGLSNTPLHGLQLIDESDQPHDASHVICQSRLGGPLMHYEHRAA